jgi:L-asparaginase / beta-aspartyl-peptidase
MAAEQVALIVHGGAGSIPDELLDGYNQGVVVAWQAGMAVLRAGGSAVDAVEAAIRVMEDDGVFDAGTGSFLNRAGVVECDAALMDAQTLAYGSVANLTRIKNPITLARKVFEGPQTMLVSVGAEEFAQQQGIALIDNRELVVERELNNWRNWQATGGPAKRTGQDTVGAIALDGQGRLIAGVSTGGTAYKLPGRVGDAPLVGCGIYAGAAGAVVATGWGEAITRVAQARRAVAFLEQGMTAQAAADAAIDVLARLVPGGEGGVIVMTPDGRSAAAWNTKRMAQTAQG